MYSLNFLVVNNEITFILKTNLVLLYVCIVIPFLTFHFSIRFKKFSILCFWVVEEYKRLYL